MNIKYAAPLAILLMVATGGYSAFAQSEAAIEAAALDAVTVPVTDAIAAVEAKNTGKVVELALLTEGNTSVYHITTLLPDGTETNYAVDAKTGAVVATIDMQDGDDHHGEGPNGDGDGESRDDGANGDGETQDAGAD